MTDAQRDGFEGYEEYGEGAQEGVGKGAEVVPVQGGPGSGGAPGEPSGSQDGGSAHGGSGSEHPVNDGSGNGGSVNDGGDGDGMQGGPGGPGGGGSASGDGSYGGPGGLGGGDSESSGSVGGDGEPPRIPMPRASVEDTGRPLPGLDTSESRPVPLVLEHRVLKALLGAWALAACSAEETAAVEEHLGECGACADEALRLRGAVGLLHPVEPLDLDPGLRTRVLTGSFDRRPPRIPVPEWATPYDAETARLDALLQDIGDAEWHAPVRLRWFDGEGPTSRRTTVAGVIAHLLTVDGLVAAALGLDDPPPLSAALERGDPHAGETVKPATPAARTEAYWRASYFPPTRSIRAPWREQSHDIVRTVSFTGGTTGKLAVSYGDFELPLHDAMLDRAFECWVHAQDIADAVDYPYEPPSARYLNRMIDLAARMLPAALAERRRHGLASPGPGRSLRLEIEGHGGGEWLIPLDSLGAVGSAEREVAHIALDGVEFCHLAAGHVSPEDAAAGQLGDRGAIRDVLFATASLSRM